MNIIKFSNDYEKLPLNWVNSTAKLIGVYNANISTLKKKYSSFLKRDTKIRGKNIYYKINFEKAIVLIFIHCGTGILFSTIRENKGDKLHYYHIRNSKTFKLIEV